MRNITYNMRGKGQSLLVKPCSVFKIIYAIQQSINHNAYMNRCRHNGTAYSFVSRIYEFAKPHNARPITDPIKSISKNVPYGLL